MNERLHTTRCEYETVTYTCPQCRRKVRVLADEYGQQPCSCGWAPYESEAEISPDDHEDETEEDE